MDIEKIEGKLNQVSKKLEDSTLALEIIRENRKTIKALIIIIITLIIALVGSNIAWLIHDSQFETITKETTVDAGNGVATYLENSNSGDINYGENN